MPVRLCVINDMIATTIAVDQPQMAPLLTLANQSAFAPYKVPSHVLQLTGIFHGKSIVKV